MKSSGNDSNNTEFLYKEEGYAILGACFEVYNELGNGYLEAVYQECLVREFNDRNIPFIQKPELAIFYKGMSINQNYIPDFVCYNLIIIEIKAVANITDEHRAQIINYLKTTGLKVGYLINFGHHPKLEYERYIR